MADIKINDIKVNDIKPAGVELFDDSESFINELKDDELNNLFGGAAQGGLSSTVSIYCCVTTNTTATTVTQ